MEAIRIRVGHRLLPLSLEEADALLARLRRTEARSVPGDPVSASVQIQRALARPERPEVELSDADVDAVRAILDEWLLESGRNAVPPRLVALEAAIAERS